MKPTQFGQQLNKLGSVPSLRSISHLSVPLSLFTYTVIAYSIFIDFHRLVCSTQELPEMAEVIVTMEVGSDGVAVITISNPPVNALAVPSKLIDPLIQLCFRKIS